MHEASIVARGLNVPERFLQAVLISDETLIANEYH